MSTNSNASIQRFGEKLRDLRRHHGLTLQQLAHELGYRAHGHISELENNKKAPTLGLIVSVARYFNVSTDYLLKDELYLDIENRRKKQVTRFMSIPFVDRPPTPAEFERFRLILSTYQDGTGMLVDKRGGTLPGWRDFERSVALAFGGDASENKDIFDVRLPDPQRSGINYGISCKMRRELNRLDRDGRVTMEVSNSARKFWDHLSTQEISHANYKSHPAEVGISLLGLVQLWHMESSIERGGDVDLSKSFYLSLSWNPQGIYQLHQFELALPDASSLDWYFPTYNRQGIAVQGNHLNGDNQFGRVIEWYGESGAQLKYYPLAETSLWESERFRLEPLPQDREHGIISKAQMYFTDLWPDVTE